MHGRADEDVSDVDVEANRMKNTHLLPGNCPFGHLSADFISQKFPTYLHGL